MIRGVTPTNYILSLFIRDDGERFVLGSGYYVFKEKQMHFKANTVANDIVEVQGNDGYLLAGQVRRPGSQDFEGYVGDGTTSKTEVEARRRNFLAFFRKNHFYKVVYVFSDGTAIQRKRGFLVDDPVVTELYQIYPEYHVALNFEDVNYYSYSENEDGEEIYSKMAQISLTQRKATGGLVWDEYGIVWEGPQWGGETETASGTDFVIDNTTGKGAPIDSVQLNGDSYQQINSGKNLFKANQRAADHGITATVNSDNSLSISGTATQAGINLTASNYLTTPVPAGTTLTLSFKQPAPCTIRAYCGGWVVISAGSTSATATTTGAGTYVYLAAIMTNGATYDFTLEDIQLEIGSTATPFEPYSGGVPVPSPDSPQTVQTVTGTQTVSISDGGGNTQSYSVNLGTIELAKIDDYQDYIYKNGDDWFIHKEIDIVELGNLNWSYSDTAGSGLYRMYTSGLSGQYIAPASNADVPSFMSNYFTATNANDNYNNVVGIASNASGTAIYAYHQGYNSTTSPAGFKTWLTNNNVELYYVLKTPTDTQITDQTLIAELEAVAGLKLFGGENNFVVSSVSPALPSPIDVEYYTQVIYPGGAVWSEGAPTGPTTVEVDSIDTVFPVWVVNGPAINPRLTVLTTNTTFIYNGTVSASQELVVDMMNKTVLLNGVNVIGNMGGDWVSFSPGTNRVVYSTDNADAQASTIEWQEIIG